MCRNQPPAVRSAAPSLDWPAAINSQNCRRSSRRATPGRPGECSAALVQRSDLRLPLAIATSFKRVLRRPVEIALPASIRVMNHSALLDRTSIMQDLFESIENKVSMSRFSLGRYIPVLYDVNRRLVYIQPNDPAILYFLSTLFLGNDTRQSGATLARRMPREKPPDQSAHTAIMGSKGFSRKMFNLLTIKITKINSAAPPNISVKW